MISLQKWLDMHGLAALHPPLAQNDIDLDIIVDLSEKDLANIGLTLGQRKRLMRAIATITAPTPASLTPADTGDHHWQHTAVTDSQRAESSNAERRQLTVLFCDLVGSTELSQQLDLEDFRDVIRDYQETVGQLLEAHHGFIARYMGDGVLVYFGYPAALEDDAFSAAQAGQEILATFQESKRFIKSGFRVRIGIATGLVLAGDIIGSGVSEEHTVLGQTPNLAARLQGVAAPNQMVIDEQTWQLIRRRYRSNRLDNLALKGFSDPQSAYEIPAQQPIPLFTQQLDNKLIGRDSEIQTLQKIWFKARNRVSQFVLISGEPGIGKSRLTREFLKQIGKDEHHYIQWECSPHTTNSAFFTVLNFLQDTCGFTASDSSQTKTERIINRAEELALSSEEAQRMAQLISIGTTDASGDQGTPRERRLQLIGLFIDMLTRKAAQKPTVLVIENTHAIDPSTLELLKNLMQRPNNSSLMLIANCRPEFNSAQLDSTALHKLHLAPLNSDESCKMIAELGKLSESLSQDILRKADGIPLFIEEITHALFEAASEKLAAEGTAGGIPSSLQSLLMAKLDRLGRARDLAQLAAVIGDEIDLTLLSNLSALSEKGLLRDLNTLNTAGVLIHDASGKTTRYRFRHTLFQEIAYQTLLRDDRRQLHYKVGESIRDHQPELASSQPERVARHFSAANAAYEAIEFWHRAATLASSLSANDECLAHIESAMPHLAQLQSQHNRDHFELDLNIVHASVLRGMQGPGSDAIAKIYQRSFFLCETLGEKDKLIPVLNGLYLYNLLRTNYSKALNYAHRLLNLANESGDITSRMVGHRALGAVSFNTGDFQQASEHLQKSRLLYDPALHGTSAATIGADHLQAATNFYCATLSVQGQPETAFQLHIKELERTIEMGHAHNLAQALVFLTFQTSLTAHPQTEKYCKQLYELAEEYNFPMMLASARMFRGTLKFQHGQTSEALTEMTAATKLYQSTGTLNYLPYFNMRIAEAYLALQDGSRALELLELAHDSMEMSGEYWCRAEWLRLKGEHKKLTESDEAALAYFQQAIEDAQSRGAMIWLLRALQSLSTLGNIDKEATKNRIKTLLKDWPELHDLYSLNNKTSANIVLVHSN